jgi:hypothetical protein
MPAEPHPLYPPAQARAQLERWRHSREAAQAIRAVDQLENACMRLDEYVVWGRENEADVMDVIEVETVRYKQAALPVEVTESVLKPQMANEQNSMPCPFGFGRLVRQPSWASATSNACAARFVARGMRLLSHLGSVGTGKAARCVIGDG